VQLRQSYSEGNDFDIFRVAQGVRLDWSLLNSQIPGPRIKRKSHSQSVFRRGREGGISQR
jgi:hypothetical protein